MNSNNRYYLGLMSGTSMDGIDAAIIDASTNTFIAGLTYPYQDAVKEALYTVMEQQSVSLKNYSQLNTLLGREFAHAALELLNQSGLSSSAIAAIGSHGQTLCHDSTAEIPYTLQSGCAHTIAELTQIPVVADFRTRDVVVGGQGAPFAPLYHQALFQGAAFPLAVVNIGGIANLSYLSNSNAVHGYDLGPGNCLMDAWVKKHRNTAYDEKGAFASSGLVIEPLLDRLLHDPFFSRSYPKSLGKEYFSLNWLMPHLKGEEASQDVQATLLMLTAKSIVQGIQCEPVAPKKVFVCGGGVHNLALMETMNRLMPEIECLSTQAININPDFIEAMMFAWLAMKTLNGEAQDLSQITGARQSVILGAIYPVKS
ncbi:MAG: anhydro-N-acetylmuramic acid kinase [Tatlockia sp.]